MEMFFFLNHVLSHNHIHFYYSIYDCALKTTAVQNAALTSNIYALVAFKKQYLQ